MQKAGFFKTPHDADHLLMIIEGGGIIPLLSSKNIFCTNKTNLSLRLRRLSTIYGHKDHPLVTIDNQVTF